MAHVRRLADEIGPRPTGSDEEREAAQYVQKSLSGMGIANVGWQEFAAAQSEWLPYALASLVALLGIGLWALLRGSALGAYLGGLACAFALWEIYTKLNFGWSPLSGLVPKTQSQNVAVTIPATEEEGRNAVIFGHLDTGRAPFFFRSKGLLTAFFVTMYAAIAVLLVTLVALVGSWFGEFTLPLWVGAPVAVTATLALAAMLLAHFSPQTPGANDNASSVGVALELARYYQAHPLKHTRVWVVFTGAEETGCHGAAAFLTENGDQLLQGYAIALEGVGIKSPAYSIREGMLGSYRSNKELVRMAERAERANPGLGLRPVKLRAGYTEAGLASKRGYRALALVGTDSGGFLPNWHLQDDTAGHIREEALAAAFEATTAILGELDKLPVSIKLSAVRPLGQRG